MLSRLYFAFLLATLNLTLPAPSARAQAAAPKKRALLIAVNGYADRKDIKKDDDRWWNLNTKPDVEAIAAILKTKYKFDEVVIKILPAETTHNAILAAMDALAAKTQAGDIAYFHYSGHGSQADDSKPYVYHGQQHNLKVNDKKDTGGKDQTLVPSDYVSRVDPSNDIFGDEIDVRIAALKAKHPANITLTFDCCHAAGNTRGGGITRGGSPFTQATISPVISRGAPASGLTPGGYICISACRSDQIAVEENNSHMGLLSWALQKALNEARDHTTYDDFFRRVSSYVAECSREQEPEIEGDTTTAVLGTERIPPQPYYPVDLRGGQPTLLAGKLVGIANGTQLKIFAADADIKNDRPIAEAEVVNARSLECTLRLLTRGVKPEAIRATHGVITKIAYSAETLLVDVSGLKGHDKEVEIRQALKALIEAKKISLEIPAGKTPDLRIVRAIAAKGELEPPANSLQVINAEGTALAVSYDNAYHTLLAEDDQLPQHIADLIENDSKWRLINGLKNADPAAPVRVQVRLIPIQVKRDANGAVLKDANENAIYENDLKTKPPFRFPIEDYFRIEITNTGDQEAYINLFDLASDGTLTSLWPSPATPVDTRIDIGKTFKLTDRNGAIYCVLVAEPLGRDVIKVIATTQKVNLFALIGRGEPRGNVSPLEQVFGAFSSGARGAGNRMIAPGDWGTAEALFLTLPKVP